MQSQRNRPWILASVLGWFGVAAVMGCGADDRDSEPPLEPPAQVAAPAEPHIPSLCDMTSASPPCRAVTLREAFAALCGRGRLDGRVVTGAHDLDADEASVYEIEAGLRVTDYLVDRCGASRDALVYDSSVADLLDHNTILLGRRESDGLRRLMPGFEKRSSDFSGGRALAAEYTTTQGPVTVVLLTGADGFGVYDAVELFQLATTARAQP